MMASNRFPVRRFYGQSMQSTLQIMLSQRDTNDRLLDEKGYAGRRVMGFKLPVWQRPEVWSDIQCVRFIESVWMGVGIGSYMLNYSFKNPEADMILLDGQQRLRAIERYWDGELAIAGDDGVAHFWPDLTKEEQAHFVRIPFPWMMTEYDSDTELRDAYNRHNFGGTAHTADQYA